MRRSVPAMLAIATACGGSPSTPAPSGPAASTVATRADETDLIVAQVNGRPVWGSCVAEQSARAGVDRKAALDQCVTFELLAQAAEKRGLAADPAVIEAAHTAMVNELVATEFEARYQKPADLGAAIDKVLDKNAWRMHRPELRGSFYVRAVVPKNATAETDAKARALAEAIAAELADQTGLFPVHVRQVATRLAEGTGIETFSEEVQIAAANGDVEPPYLAALFAIPEVARVSKPARTSRGWDVILWTTTLPAREATREDLAREAFPDLRRAQFTLWVNQLIKTSNTRIELVQAAVAQLEELGP